MKGIVFTEFFNLVSQQWGADMVDDLIDAVDPPSGGAYTSVASYDFQELADLLAELAQRTQIPAKTLLMAFGDHLAQAFLIKFPDFFKAHDNLFDFLQSIESHIHIEVRKLYPDAELPSFSYQLSSPNELTMVYQSSRPLADLVEGLVRASAQYFKQNIEIKRTAMNNSAMNEEHFTILAL